MKDRPLYGVLLVSAGCLAILVLAYGRSHGKGGNAIAPRTPCAALAPAVPGSNPPQMAGNTVDGSAKPPGSVETTLLQRALAETDPARRRELLRQWAESVEVSAMANELSALSFKHDPKTRRELREVLLSSWAERDLLAITEWFGKVNAGDDLHQQARDCLLRDFAQRDPRELASWMEALPQSTQTELYAPFFTQWASTDPVSASATLRKMLETSQGSSGLRDNLIAQVGAVWADTDLHSAIGWLQTLPESPAKSQALVQASYRWTETSPQAAASFAAQRNDPALLKAVAGKWTERDPGSAAVWAAGLPAGEGADAAAVAVAARWAQKQPAAAAAYLGTLPSEKARNQAMVVVASAWADADPSNAAKWVTQLPEGTGREQALEQVVGAWAAKNAMEARAWVSQLNLPPDQKTVLLSNVF